MSPFRLHSDFKPCGDQPRAIETLAADFLSGKRHNLLLGVTGSGKTFTMAHLIQKLQRPTLVLAHNKTLATQLYGEFKELFPDNAVEYFVSYYDYYQPEAYLPGRDLYIEKESSINKNIEKMRHSTTRSALERRDVVVVSSVSCIYGLGNPEEYRRMTLFLTQGEDYGLTRLMARLVEIQYARNDVAPTRGQFRVRGDIVDIFPPYEDQLMLRLKFFGDEIESIERRDPLLHTKIGELKKVEVLPASHYVTGHEGLKLAIASIRAELKERLGELEAAGRLLEYQRLKERVRYDLEMLEQTGFCSGIENYSRHLTGGKPGEPPCTLFDYLPPDTLLLIDESHASLPQLHGMYNGDRTRKQTLVDFGFRLPSALDNRPMRFEEFEGRTHQRLYITATPGAYELEKSGVAIQQIIRPTGLIDPVVEIRPQQGQVEDLIGRIRERTARGHRVLVTTLTKKMSEELTQFLIEGNIRVRYLHSDIDVIERSAIIRDLRTGKFDVLVGINLLREGLDLPEVSLVAILDADKEGFLRSKISLIQTIGRAARHIEGTAVLYADIITPSIRDAIDETDRRRQIQLDYNIKNNITPESIRSNIKELLTSIHERDYIAGQQVAEEDQDYGLGEKELHQLAKKLEKQMLKLAGELEFEKAAEVRDRLRTVEAKLLEL